MRLRPRARTSQPDLTCADLEQVWQAMSALRDADAGAAGVTQRAAAEKRAVDRLDSTPADTAEWHDAWIAGLTQAFLHLEPEPGRDQHAATRDY